MLTAQRGGLAPTAAPVKMRDVQMCFQVLRRFHEQAPITELITSTAKLKKVGQAELFATAA